MAEIVKREPPKIEMLGGYLDPDYEAFRGIALEDIAAKRHARGCECVLTEHPYTRDIHRPNACPAIAAAALKGEAYSVEVSDD